MTPSRAVVALGCSASLLAGGCGDGTDAGDGTSSATTGAAGGPALRQATVNIASFAFEPRSVTVAAGATVDFVNRDKAPHTAQNTGEDGPAEFDTGRLERGGRSPITFTKPGTYPYYCIYHRFMQANVIVR